jgi:hypothetical protein
MTEDTLIDIGVWLLVVAAVLALAAALYWPELCARFRKKAKWPAS